MNCLDREGVVKPVFDPLAGTEGDCVSCYEYNADTPVWNGTTCEACPENTFWDVDTLSCKECAFVIEHTENDITSKLCLAESVANSAYKHLSPTSAEEETAEFQTKYNLTGGISSN